MSPHNKTKLILILTVFTKLSEMPFFVFCMAFFLVELMVFFFCEKPASLSTESGPMRYYVFIRKSNPLPSSPPPAKAAAATHTIFPDKKDDSEMRGG